MRWLIPKCADGNTLPILPNEIYLYVIDLIHYSADWDEDDRRCSLSNLALSCVLFRGFIVPRMFKSLYFVGGQEDPKLHCAVNSAAFCRALNSGTEPAVSLAHHVEECILENWTRLALISTITTAFLNMYRRAFLRMPNLHKLSLSRVAVNSCLLKTICKLKNLRSLELDHIDFSITTFTHGFRKMPPITSLCLKDDVGDDESIVARVFNVAHLRKLSATRCIQVLPLLPHTLTLVELRLMSVESTTAFWNAISRFEALTTLELKYVTVGSGTSSQQLNASTLPRLRHLLAPPSFSYIVANRFLSSVDLMDGVQGDQMKKITQLSSQILTTEVTENFTPSASGLISLLIPFELCSIGGLSKKFPDLQNLTIMTGHPNFDFNLEPNGFDSCGYIKSCINEVVTKWSLAPSVKSLELKMKAVPSHNERKYLYDLELQHDLIYQTVAAFPNVQKVQFFDYLEWTRESCGDNWTGYIPFEFHSRIRSQLNDDHYVGKDVDGLLLPFLMFDAVE